MKKSKINLADKFPLKATFDGIRIKAVPSAERDTFLAKASLENLAPFLPKGIDFEKNYDLVPVTFNAFVANRGNKNGQMVEGSEILPVLDLFIHKFINIEHQRHIVVGVITNYGFSEFGTDKPLTLEEVRDMKDPFNVVLGGVLWRAVNEDFCELVEEASDSSSASYKDISASWEVFFRDYDIRVGSKNFAECSVINDAAQIENLKKYLKFYGGKGIGPDGQPMFLNIIGEILPAGVGFTQTPAAEVSGVLVTPTETEEVEEEVAHEHFNYEYSCGHTSTCKCPKEKQTKKVEEPCPLCIAKVDISEESEEKISQSEKATVKENATNDLSTQTDTNPNEHTKYMKIDLKKINDEQLKEVSASAIRDSFEDAMTKASEQWTAEKAEKETLLQKSQEALEAAKAALAEITTAHNKLNEEISTIKTEQAKAAKAAAYQARMTSLEAEYALSDEEKTLIAEEILDKDEEGFNKWFKSFSVLAKSKSKAVIAEAAKKVEEATASAATKTEEQIKADKEAKAAELADAIDKGEVKNDEVANAAAATAGADNIQTKMAVAFKLNEGMTIEVGRKKAKR